MDFSLSGGTQVMGFISPFDTNDSYAVIDPLYGIDGLRNVASLTEMNAIPDARRREGMTVGVKDVSGTTYYLLNSSPWSGVTGDWTSGYTINDSGEFIIENVHITNLFGASPITVYDNLQYDSNVASGDKSTAFGSGNTVSGDYSFVNSLNSIVSGNRSILLGGQNLTGDTDDTLYVPNIRVFNDMVIDGSVTINGTATTINTEILLVEDNLITLNSTFTAGTPSVDAGIEILRGSGTTSQLLWDESTNRWYAGLSGNTAQILLSTDGLGNFTGNTSGTCIDDIYVSNIYGCSPITINSPLILGSNPRFTATTFNDSYIIGVSNTTTIPQPVLGSGNTITLYSEDFGNGSPWTDNSGSSGAIANGWSTNTQWDAFSSINYLGTGGNGYGGVGSSSGYDGSTGNGGIEFISALGNGTVYLTYDNNLSTTGITSSSVIWGAATGGWGSTTIGAEVSTDGVGWTALTFTDVASASWSLVNGGVPIPFPPNAIGVSNLRFRFVFNDDWGFADYNIDDVKFQGVLPPDPVVPNTAMTISNVFINGINNTVFSEAISGVTILGDNITADTSDRIYLGNEISIPNITTATTTDTEVILTVPSDGGVVSYKTASFLWSGGTGNNSINKRNNNSTATGDNSLAIGSGSTASGNGSIAVGSSSVASGLNSFAGGQATASGSTSFSFGDVNTVVNGDWSSILGGQNNVLGVNGDNSTILGGENNNIGDGGTTGNFDGNTIAGGNNNRIESYGATTEYNTILGGLDNTIRDSLRATILGGYNNLITGGTNTIVGGSANTVITPMGFAFGQYVTIDGSYSMAFGDSITSVGSNKLTLGNQLTSTGNTSILFGKSSNSYGSDSFTQGVSNDNYGLLAVTHGWNNNTYGDESFTQGNANNTYGLLSFTQGSDNNTYGDGSFTQGKYNDTYGEDSTTQGVGNITNNNLSHIEGFRNISNNTKPFISGVTDTVVVPIGYMRANGAGWAPILSGDTGNPYDDFEQNGAIWDSRVGQTFTVYGGSDPNETFVLTYVNYHGEFVASTISGRIYLRGANQTDITGTTHTFISGSSVTGTTQISGVTVGCHAQGRYVNAGGNWTHAAGRGLDDLNRVVALGDTSFAHFEVTEDNGHLGAYADNSAILGGINNHILSGATGSTVFGGAGITATTPDTVYVPNLVINTTPITDEGIDNILIRDTDGTVKMRSSQSLSLDFTGNTSGNCIDDIYVSNIYGCSPIVVNSPFLMGSGTDVSTVSAFTDTMIIGDNNTMVTASGGGGGESVIYSTDFSTGVSFPTGWSIDGSSDITYPSSSNPSTGYVGASGSGHITFDDDYYDQCGGQAERLIFSNFLSTAGLTDIKVIWGASLADDNFNGIDLEWSSDGSIWNTLAYTQVADSGGSSWGLVNGGTPIALPVQANNVANLRFRWTWYEDCASQFYYMDDVTIYGTSPVPTTAATENLIVGHGNTAATNSNVVVFGNNNDIQVSGVTVFGSNLTVDTADATHLGTVILSKTPTATSSNTNNEILVRNSFGGLLTTTIPYVFTTGSSGTNSIVAVNNSTVDATGDRSVAIGFNSLASGDDSFVAGYSSDATGDRSVAWGLNTLASGINSFAAGLGSKSTGFNSFAIGNNTQSTSSQSFAFGLRTISSQTGTLAGGIATHSLARGSHASGQGDFINDPPQRYVIAGGFATFNHSMVDLNYPATSSGATAHYSAILGGRNQAIESDSLDSAILGGSGHTVSSGITGTVIIGGVDVTATTVNTVYVPNLNIDTTPTLDKTADTLAIDSNGKVVKLDNSFTILPSLTGATWDLSTDSLNAEITLTGNTTLTISGVSNGDEGILKVVQDGVGSHTISIPANSKVAKGGGGVVTLTTAINSIDIIRFRYDGTDFLWDVFDDYT